MNEPVWISCRDYDELKKGKCVELAVESKGRPIIMVSVRHEKITDNDHPDYENAVFNGEVN